MDRSWAPLLWPQQVASARAGIAGGAAGGRGMPGGRRAARGGLGAARPGRRGAVASCGRGLARRFRPPRRGVPAPAQAGWARRGLRAGVLGGRQGCGGQQVLPEGEGILGARVERSDLCGGSGQ